MNLSRSAGWIAFAALMLIFTALALQRWEGALSGNWSLVLFGASTLAFAFSWDGLLAYATK